MKLFNDIILIPEMEVKKKTSFSVFKFLNYSITFCIFERGSLLPVSGSNLRLPFPSPSPSLPFFSPSCPCPFLPSPLKLTTDLAPVTMDSFPPPFYHFHLSVFMLWFAFVLL
ncbi:hypothetical protein ES288_D05G162300v1 [Gossypium darwinii]|uniref:Uncharacterized protein n=2 Tax=Gossypium TaxID=3633 RepID=A0A5D2KVQ2_GOSTO|nr:hypothetical protein ES288_D05G162300v1 [Gossypium darwinii]TYH71127.1 hypothetical protein ES332_D05G163100v1 [Gossypium tomentosum]